MLYLLGSGGLLLPLLLLTTGPPPAPPILERSVVDRAERSEGSEVGGVWLPPVESTELDEPLGPFSGASPDDDASAWLGLEDESLLDLEMRRSSLKKEGIVLAPGGAV